MGHEKDGAAPGAAVTIAEKARELVSIREYSRRRGIHHTTVLAAIRQGRVHLIEGKLDPVAADQELEANTDPSKQGRKLALLEEELAGQNRTAAETTVEAAAGSTDYMKERARREKIVADLKELELEEKRGTLLDAEEIKAEAFRLMRGIRDALMNIPAKLAGKLASETDIVKVEKMLEAEFRKTIEGFVDGEKR